MKKFKKLSAALLALAMLVSLLPTAFAAEDATVWANFGAKADGVTRIGIFSDSHLIGDTSRLDLAFQSFTNIGGVDGVMMVGDIVYMNKKDILYPQRYTLLNETINKYDAIKNLPIAYVMGNHEFPEGTTDAAISADSQQTFINGMGLTTERTGVKEVSGANAVYEIGGYTVVAASPEAYSNKMTAETEAWAKAKIEEALTADASKPVFYLQHQPIQNTVRSSGTLVNSAGFVDWIKTQPRVINFTAHCHYSAYDPQSIWQSDAGFTAIHSPVLGGGYLSGIVGSYERSNITDAAYALLMEIDSKGKVTVHKLDLYNGEEAGSPYVIDVNSSERLYTDARFETANAPVFQNNEEVTVDSVTGHSVTVTFPDSAFMTETVEGVSNDGFVLYWKVEAVNKATGDVSQYVNRYGDFWTKNGYDKRTVTINNLDRNTDYTINVIPVSPLLKQGAPISAEITTTNEKDATDAALISTKRLNVAAHKMVTASAPDATYVPANLTDDNRQTFVIPGPNSTPSADTFVIDLEKRYVVDTVEVYDRYETADEGGRCCIAIDGSNDPDFATYDVLDELGPHDKIVQNAAGLNVGDHTLFPDNGCFAGSGNGQAYRYIRVRRTGGYYYGYSEIKVWANQDVTEVTRKKNVKVDDQYSSAYAGSKAVNGTVSGDSDAWVSEEGGKYHYLTVDMETPKNIGLIEMVGRNIKLPDTGEQANTTSQRNYWQIYGSNSLISDDAVLTDSHTLDEAATGYTKLLQTNSNSNYIAGEYIFPEYPGSLQQVVSDSTPYRYITFKRGGAAATHGIGSTYLGEVRGYVLNPMVNAVSAENGVISVEFSDTMDAETINNETIKLYDGVSEEEIAATVELSDDKYTAVVTPADTASFYKISVADEALNECGTDLAADVVKYTTPDNIYAGLEGRKDIYANVALNKPVTTAGVTVYDGFWAEYANDGTVGRQAQVGDGVDVVLGTAIGVGAGYLQIDLQNRYNLEQVDIITRQDNQDMADTPDFDERECYIKKLKVMASNDENFETYDVLDEIDEVDKSKLDIYGKWTINLNGAKDYRYLRVERTTNVGEWGFAEIRAYAKFDGISVTKNATASAYYQYGKGETYEAAFAPQTVIDNNTGTFYAVFTDQKPADKFNYLQIDLKNKYHIGYAELTSREPNITDVAYYQHFDLFGSNIGDTVSDDEVETHPYLNTKLLETVEGYTNLSRVYANVSLGEYEELWEQTGNNPYQVTFDDSEAYQYVTYKTNSKAVGSEISEIRLYATAQRVNSVDVAEDGRVTVNFAGELIASTANEDTIKMKNAAGETVALSDIEVGKYSYSFIPAESDGTIIVSSDVMNTYAVPMAADYTAEITGYVEKEAIENASFTVLGADAEALAANTEYVFAADFNNTKDSAVSIYAMVAIYDKDGRLVKVESEKYENITDAQAISVSITTDADVSGQTVYAYILTDDFAPFDGKIDVLAL